MGTGIAIDEIYYPREDIRQGFDWYDGTGLTLTADENISNVVFEIVFKRGEQVILTLSEDDSTIVHSGNYIIRLKVSATISADLSTGVIRGDLMGAVSGYKRFMGTIETVIR
jgi:hypothetical protein